MKLSAFEQVFPGELLMDGELPRLPFCRRAALRRNKGRGEAVIGEFGLFWCDARVGNRLLFIELRVYVQYFDSRVHGPWDRHTFRWACEGT